MLPVLLLALFTACSKDDIIEEGGSPDAIESVEEVPVTFNLGVTRGVLTPADNDGELITSYMIVVAKDGTVVKIIKQGTVDITPAEMHNVKTKLTSGDYKVYAFANIPFSKLDNIFGVNQPLPATQDLQAMYYGDDNTFRNGCTGPVPMSCDVDGKDITVLPSKGNATYGIEVVRMLAKIEFVFMNSSSQPLTVNSVTMGPLTTKGSTTNGFVPLFPYNDATDLSFYSGFSTEDYTHNLGISLPKDNASSQTSKSFYVVESNPDPVTKAFNLAFNVQRGSETAEVRYALLEKALVENPGINLDGDLDRSPFIRRNDWIRIPIDLGDYEFRLQARSYPPIGGYPEVNVDEFKVNFTYHGYFSITPTIRKYGTNDWISLDDESVIKNYTVTVDTSSTGLTDIFTTNGKPVKKLSEIVGTIRPDAHGTACVTLTVNVIVSQGVTRTLTRKMYITV